MATSSDTYLRLAVEDERNKPSPYFRARDYDEALEPRNRSELAKLVMENRMARPNRKRSA